MKKLINILFVLAAIVALVVSAFELRRRSASAKASRGALAAVLEKNTVLLAQIASLKSQASASRQSDPADGPAKNTARNKQVEEQRAQSTEKIKQSLAQTRAYFNALEERKANDREFGLKYYASLRSTLDVQYGPFYRLQHLTREQTDALSEALFQRQLRYEKANAERQAGGSDADAKAAKAGADAEFAASAQEALGADAHEQFQLYERQRKAWDYVGAFGGMLSLVDMPLSLEQSARMADAIANANEEFRKGNAVEMFVAATDWDAVDTAAAEFLTPGQLDFLKNVNVSSAGGVSGYSSSRQQQEFDSATKNLER